MASENLTQTLSTEPRSKGTVLAPSTIKPGRWFRQFPSDDEPTVAGAFAKTLVGVAAGALAYFLGAVKLAIFIWIVAVLIGIVTLSSQKARSGVGRFFATLGRSLGWLLGFILLTPIYLIGFTTVHVIGWLAERDPLYLRDRKSQTFWLPADQDCRKVKYIRSLFATETRGPSHGWAMISLISLAGLIVAAELVLRTFGFGNAILYQLDDKAGYYPAPNQAEHRYGGFIQTNSHGMRAPEFELQKKPGTLRILMLGDSTLWGGSYIDQRELYARLLDDALDARPGANDVEILNVAANAWGPFNELGYVEKYGTYDADVAVIALPIGDIYRPFAHLYGLPYFHVGAPPRLALEEVLHHLNWRSRAMTRKPPTEEEQAAQGKLGIEAYVQLAEKLKAKGCEVLFEVLPSEAAGMSDTAPANEQQAVDDLRAALEPLGFKVGYPVGLFRDHAGDGELYHDYVHLHKAGQHVYADYLKSRLERESEKLRAHRQGGHESSAAAEDATP